MIKFARMTFKILLTPDYSRHFVWPDDLPYHTTLDSNYALWISKGFLVSIG